MKQRRYKEDYGFETFMDQKGREKRRAVYRGKWYAYEDGAQAAGALGFSLACAAVSAGCWLGYMLLSTPSSRCMYVLPVACCALIPLAYWIMGLWGMHAAPGKMTSVQKENGAGRVLRSAAGCMVLLGMACVGDMIFMALGGSLKDEIAGFALLFGAAAAAAGCFARMRGVYSHMTEKKG